MGKYKKHLFLITLSLVSLLVAFNRVNAVATITVDTSADNSTASDGFCTLREAIVNSNNDTDSTGGDCVAGSGNDIIEFDITSNEGAGPHTISVSTDLPELNDTTTIDGYSETGAAENTALAPAPFDGTIMVQLDGGGTVDRGFWAGTGSDGSIIKGLSITGFDIDGILLEPADDQTVVGNYIGLQPDGSTVDANNNGVVVNNSDDDTIGGTSPADRNIISGNTNYGIAVDASLNTSNNTVIRGNYIGVGADGTSDKGNGSDGISTSYDGITIGGTTSGSINLISGNQGDGIRVNGDSNLNIQGNYIGTTYTGSSDLGNNLSGVSLHGGGNNTVGGNTSSARNILSGNDQHGVFLASNSNENTISGNYIGVGANGSTAVANTNVAVSINSGSSSNLIGGTTSGEANVIRRNTDNGVAVSYSSSTDNAIIGNSLSSNASPNIDLGNDGSTSNDTNDSDTGPNDLLNYPVWGLFDDDSGNTEVTYDLDVPAGSYRVETFSDNGKTLVDTQNITHTGSGSEEFSNTITGNGYSALRMTVTEIDAGEASGFGSTSEYSDAYSDGTATITVNSTADDEDDDGECTLREAITAANDDVESGDSDGECLSGAGEDTIEFDIAGAGPHTIEPTSALPWINSDNITISGYSETGAVENSATVSACFNGTIQIELDGSSAGSSNGLIITGDNVIVRGLAINDFSDNGITINGGSNSVVSGNLIGTNTAGLVDKGNGDAGIAVNSGTSATIGGTNPEDRNLISGNEGFGGISIYSDTSAVSVLGNCVGLDATGDTALPNNHHGFNIYDAGGDISIGGSVDGSRNIISGNDEQGVSLDQSSVDLIAGNYIGTNVDGSSIIANGTQGIWVDSDASVDLIGGTTATARNVISGNTYAGITIDGGSSTIQGNYIGLSADGTTDLGNSQQGIYLQSDNNTIGGPNTSARNVISGNTQNGIGVNAGSDSNTIQNNYIGLSSDGLDSVPNCSASNNPNVGISSDNNNILDNVIGYCEGSNNPGIQLLGGFGTERGGNKVQGNYIGTDKNGNILGSTDGAAINVVADTSNNLIGGTAQGDGNLIRGFGGGVAIVQLEPIPAGQNNSIISNKIYENNGGLFTNLGIDLLETPDFGSSLVEKGVTPNDTNDTDTGSNDYINFPVLDSSSASAGQLNVQFDLDVDGSAPNGYRVEFFANTTGDASGNGEGQFYLGSYDVAGDVTNEAASITLDPGAITTGSYDITATVTEKDNSTDGFGATSEFSAFLDNQSVIQPLDNDGDGVNDSVEAAGPNSGDANGDGTQDNLQADVATILDSTGNNYLTLELEDGGTCNTIEDFSASTETEQGANDTGYDYPMGLNQFTIPCADSVNGRIFYHAVESLGAYTHRKYGPTTPGDSSTDAWYNANFTYSTATVGGDTVATASFSLTDGVVGDDTADDDSIVDDNGPGTIVTQSSSGGVLTGNLLAETGQRILVYVALASVLIILGSVFLVKRFSSMKKR